jgi:hypothetical protein
MRDRDWQLGSLHGRNVWRPPRLHCNHTLQAYRVVASATVHGGKFPMSAKKMAKKIAKKKAKPAAKKRRLPRKEDVPDYSPGLPDMEK